jgi:two-component system sensor histidine kinase BaeS
VSPQVSLRHSLFLRLLVTSVLIAVLAVAATAWLATRTATQAISRQQGRSLSDEKALYVALTGYAATHPDWSGVQSLLSSEATTLDRRITLTDSDGLLMGDSATGPAAAAPRAPGPAAATIDPLHLDLSLTGGSDSIDNRAVGPYRLAKAEAARLLKAARAVQACARRSGVAVSVQVRPSGRPDLVSGTGDREAGQRALTDCGQSLPIPLLNREKAALDDLSGRVNQCLKLPRRDRTSVGIDFQVAPFKFPDGTGSWSLDGGKRASACLTSARRSQLRTYVAGPVQLYVTDPSTGTSRFTFSLTRANVEQIAGTALAVLLVTTLVTALLGRRLIRPLRALTEGAARQERVPVSGKDEIAYLSAALNQAMERRDRAEAQRREMVGDVAHELRNPLTNIRSWLESAQDGLTRTDPQLVDLLHEEALILQHIVQDLADLAEADAGTLRMHPAPTKLRDVLLQIRDAHHSAAHTAGVELGVLAPDDLPLVWVDPVRIRQLVGNLVSNGIRHTPPGGSVILKAWAETDLVGVTIEDTGIGIEPENLPRIFDRFWRADPSRTRATGGSGLGLSIARQIAEAHSGRLTARSTPGVGTAVTLHLPLAVTVAVIGDKGARSV